MKANELRIGNWVMTPRGSSPFWDGEKETVSEPRPVQIEEIPKIKNKQIEYDFISLCSPIPLTEEWLLKFGFENYNGNFWMNGDISIIQSPGKKNYLLVVDDFETHHLGNPFEYVHQLQNLYFALTGIELEIKSPG